MTEIIIRNWYLRVFRAQVNFLLPIRQVPLPIQLVRTPIRGLLTPIGQVVPQISHIDLYRPYRSHLHPSSRLLVPNSTIVAEHKVKSVLTIAPCHDHELTPSTAYTENSIRRVHHPPKVVCLPIILTMGCWFLNEASGSGVPLYRSTGTSQLSLRAQC